MTTETVNEPVNEVSCEHCGNMVDTDAVLVVEGTDLCQSCYNDDTAECTQCHCITIDDDDRSDSDNNLFCEDCADNLRNCHRCDSIFHIDRMNADIHDHNICNSCTESYYSTCEDCGGLCRISEIVNSGGSSYCGRCIDDHPEEDEDDGASICEYGFKPSPIFYGEDAGLYMGVELEMEGSECNADADTLSDIVNSYRHEHMYVKSDSSLDDGFECVSHPATLEYHTKNIKWEDMLRKAVSMGFRSHQAGTCGLHVHISRRYFGHFEVEQDAGIMKMLYLMERFWDKALRFSRRTDSQLSRWAKRYGLNYNEEPSTLLDRAKRDNARYRAINLQNVHTIELRLFRGTLRYNTFIATLQFCHLLSILSKTLSVQQVTQITWEEFVSHATELEYVELIIYLKERRLWVNASSEQGVEI